MVAGLWEVGLWQEGGQAAYSQGQFRSVFSVKLFVELSRPRPDFIDILAPTAALMSIGLRPSYREPTATPAVLKSLTQAREQPAGKACSGVTDILV
jgi:hypothetical protein